MNENDSDEHNSRCHVNLQFFDKAGVHSDLVRFLLAGVLVVAFGGIIFAVSMVHHRDYLAAQANIFAHTFIRNSAVVDQELGKVQQIKEIRERHQTGKAFGWYLNYDVTGRRAHGVVYLRLTRDPNFDGNNMPVQWNLPSAELDIMGKLVNLR